MMGATTVIQWLRLEGFQHMEVTAVEDKPGLHTEHPFKGQQAWFTSTCPQLLYCIPAR